MHQERSHEHQVKFFIAEQFRTNIVHSSVIVLCFQSKDIFHYPKTLTHRTVIYFSSISQLSLRGRFLSTYVGVPVASEKVKITIPAHIGDSHVGALLLKISCKPATSGPDI